MSIIFVFVDGVGLGREDDSNPFVTASTPFLTSMLQGEKLTQRAAGRDYTQAALIALDAGLSLGGLPQSATGQTTLFTGINAALLLGRHLKGFPDETLRPILAEHGIFLQLRRKFRRGSFANAYRPGFFRELNNGLNGYHSCSTLIAYYGGLTFRTLDDLAGGKAVYMDITHTVLRSLGFNMPLVTPQEAGKRLARIAAADDLTLFEHFITDIAGHKRNRREAEDTVITLDAFLGAVALEMAPDDLLLVTSDHGNLEDLTTNDHTVNAVPALVVGKQRGRLVELLAKGGSITAVTPALLELLSY